MKLSETWLRKWINLTINHKKLITQIIMAGFEVEEITPLTIKYNEVIIGEIIDCIKLPNKFNLQLAKVNIGDNHILNIICKAPNCRKEMKVVVKKKFNVLFKYLNNEIKKTYNNLSNSILCSYSDLVILDDNVNIIELPNDAPIGIQIHKYLQLNDNILKINITPNRPDCLSILGIARDIAAINKINLQTFNVIPVKSTKNSNFKIYIQNPEACPRFLARIINDIDLTVETPNWIKETIYRSGIHSMNPIIDIINYVLLELGQPLHVYNLEYLNNYIFVRMAKQNEKLLLSNNNEIILQSDTLVIADQKQVLSLAGILGSKSSNINKNTTSILLECAFFTPSAIFGRSRYYGVFTESSYRFERGVDFNIQYKALEYTTTLILQICGGTTDKIIDISNNIYLPKIIKIILTKKKINNLLGYNISNDDIINILNRLGFHIVIYDNNSWQVTVPSWRFDIHIEEDLISEIIRISKYDNVPCIPPHLDLITTSLLQKNKLSLNRVKTLLIDHSYNEVITYSFVDPKIQTLLYPDKKSIIIPHPISNEMSSMRISLLPGLLMALIYNQNRQKKNIKLFESGLRFIPNKNNLMHDIKQEFMLSGVITSYLTKEHWLEKKRNVDFFDIKGDVEAILELTGQLDDFIFKVKPIYALHPGQSAEIYLHNNYVGYLGLIHPTIENKLNLKNKTLVFELKWNGIFETIIPKINIISRFPANRRDISIIVSNHIPTIDILNEFKKKYINYLVDINLFDVYYGKDIPAGFKSLGISLIIQDMNRTLEEEEINKVVHTCINILKQQFQVSLRK